MSACRLPAGAASNGDLQKKIMWGTFGWDAFGWDAFGRGICCQPKKGRTGQLSCSPSSFAGAPSESTSGCQLARAASKLSNGGSKLPLPLLPFPRYRYIKVLRPLHNQGTCTPTNTTHNFLYNFLILKTKADGSASISLPPYS